jgi:hypothetical protein
MEEHAFSSISKCYGFKFKGDFQKISVSVTKRNLMITNILSKSNEKSPLNISILLI